MLYELYLNDYFDYKNYLLNKQTELEISPNELVILIALLNDFKKGITSISLTRLESTLLLHKNDIQMGLSNLIERKFIEIYIDDKDVLAKEKYKVDNLFNIIESNYNKVKENTNQTDNEKILAFVEKKLNHLLSSQDYETISFLINEEKHTLEDFKSTINFLEKAKYNLTIKNIERYIGSNNRVNNAPKNKAFESLMKRIKH